MRAVAPFIRHKSVDPAVLVIDETGKFCISLLSGHAGGANELAERIGDLIGATPVITTATDREDKFAVDDFARKNDLVLTDWKLAKKISAAILEGERIGFCSELPVEGSLPKELSLLDSKEGEEFWAERKSACENIEKFHHKRIIIVSCRSLEDLADPDTLQLIPKLIVAGIGCRKGTPEKKIAFAIARCLKEEQIRPEALSALASIELKREEEGLLSYCKSRGLPFLTYSTDTLKQVPGEFTDSPFVKQVTGVSNVCERSAAASGGCLICRKRIYEGVTVALAKKKGSVVF